MLPDVPDSLPFVDERLDQLLVIDGEPALGQGPAVGAGNGGAVLGRVKGGAGLHASLYGMYGLDC